MVLWLWYIGSVDGMNDGIHQIPEPSVVMCPVLFHKRTNILCNFVYSFLINSLSLFCNNANL